MNIRKLLPFSAVLAIVGIAPNVSAQLWVYEPFDYADGTFLLGASGGQGFSGAWREHSAGSVPAGSFTAVAGSLVGPAGLPTSGGHAYLTGGFGTLQPARDFGNIAGSAGTTTWISFIGQRVGTQTDPNNTDWPNNPWPRGVNVSFFDTEANANASRPERIGVGNSSNAADDQWSIIPEGSGSLREGSSTPWGTLAWAVLRIDHIGDHTVADNAWLWLDPDPAVEPNIASADVEILNGDANALDYSNLDFMRPFVGNESSSAGSSNWRPAGELLVDEIRIGGDYAAMSATTVVPEPTSLALLGLGGLALLVRRRNRR